MLKIFWRHYKSASLSGGAKVQVTGHRSQVRSQVTGHRPQVTGHRLGYRPQVTGHRPQVRSQVTQKTLDKTVLD